MKKHLVYTAIVCGITFGFGCSSKSKKDDIIKDETPKAEAPKTTEHIPVNEEAKNVKPHWGYDGLFGPALWGNLDPTYATCKDGQMQSPIDLIWKKPKSQRDLQLNFKAGPLGLKDNGHTITVAAPDKSVSILGGSEYQLKNIQFHASSEHTLSGKSFPMEIHFVHADEKGLVAVVGVLVKEGTANSELQKILDYAPKVKNQIATPDNTFDPSLLLPKVKTHYHYMGSFTTPPCTEGVNWNVLNTPITASKEQIAQFKTFYRNNNRPVQSLNNREVMNF